MPISRKKKDVAKHNHEQGIETIMHRITDLLTRYQKQAAAVAAVVVVLLLVIAVTTYMRSQNERSAAPMVAVAYEVYSPGNQSAPDYGRALGMFREVQKKYAGTMSAAIAQYYAGNCLANAGRNEEALKEYQAFTNEYFKEKFLLGLVYQRMGALYQVMGRQQDAIKTYEMSEALMGPGIATVEIARLYESAGNLVDSKQKYKTVQEKLGGTAWSREAMGKVQLLAPAPGSKEGSAK